MLSHKHIGTEHLLLGILRSDTRESRMLATLGITLDAGRRAVLQSEASSKKPVQPPPPVTRQEVQAVCAPLMSRRY